MWWGIGCLPCGGLDLRPTSPPFSPLPEQLFCVAALGCLGVKQIKVTYTLVNAALYPGSCSSATGYIQATQGLFLFIRNHSSSDHFRAPWTSQSVSSERPPSHLLTTLPAQGLCSYVYLLNATMYIAPNTL